MRVGARSMRTEDAGATYKRGNVTGNGCRIALLLLWYGGVVWELPLNCWCVLGPRWLGGTVSGHQSAALPAARCPCKSTVPRVAPRHVHAACAAYVRADWSAVPPAASAVPPAAAAANGEIRARDRAHCRREHRAQLSTGIFTCVHRCGQRRAFAVALRRRRQKG